MKKARDPRSAGLPRWCGRGCRPRVRICVCRPCPLYCQSGHQRRVRRTDEESMSNLGFNSGEETWEALRCAGHVESKVAERKGGPQGSITANRISDTNFGQEDGRKSGCGGGGKPTEVDGSRRGPPPRGEAPSNANYPWICASDVVQHRRHQGALTRVRAERERQPLPPEHHLPHLRQFRLGFSDLHPEVGRERYRVVGAF